METEKRKVMGITGVLAFLAVCGLGQMLNLKGNTLAVSNSWFSVFAWGVCWFLSYRAWTDISKGMPDRRGAKIAAVILGGLFAVCIIR